MGAYATVKRYLKEYCAKFWLKTNTPLLENAELNI